jgi:hypothetical protein
MSKRGDRAAPPPGPDEWDVLLHTSDAADGWDELCQAFPGPAWEAWVILRTRPTWPANPERQHKLKLALKSREIKGKALDQWQYEVSGGARIWYCPDPDTKKVYVTNATTGHPKRSEKKR